MGAETVHTRRGKQAGAERIRTEKRLIESAGGREEHQIESQKAEKTRKRGPRAEKTPKEITKGIVQ